MKLNETDSTFLPAACIGHRFRTAVFFNDQDVLHMWEFIWLQTTGSEPWAVGAYSGYCQKMWIRASQELGNVYGRAILAARKAEVVNSVYKILNVLTD